MKKTFAVISMLGMLTATSAFAHDKEHMEMKVDKHIKMMDTNNDGMVSKEEHAAGGEKMFEKADANSDGMVSKEEMIDMKKKEWKETKDSHSGMVKKDGAMMDKK